eukprot:TRINITY_DN58056_c0_g1_i1.p1 TRINITY_DN58056_c0_g1~~TRINITY_DN58056_c0_g1_i1.p1  ORF type:complete len:193 (+),score=28.92 TRINITY_DN58056_c0_g1_i1:65-643(+)
MATTENVEERAEVLRFWSAVEAFDEAAAAEFQKPLRNYLAKLRRLTQNLRNEVVSRFSTFISRTRTVATDPTVQVTSASAAAGGVACGVVGGSVGLVSGAVVGVVPAVFTFGLSIPVFATIGLCSGAVAGGAAGAVGGGTVGYGGFKYRKEIRDRAQDAWSKVRGSVKALRTRARHSTAGSGGTDASSGSER